MTASRSIAPITLLALCLAAAAPWPIRAQSIGEPFVPEGALFLPLLGRAADLRDLPSPPPPRPPPPPPDPAPTTPAPQRRAPPPTALRTSRRAIRGS